MTLALLEHPHRPDQEIAAGDTEPSASYLTLGGIRGMKMIAVHARRDDPEMIAQDAGLAQRIGNSARNRRDRIDRAIVQIRRKQPIGPVVHASRHDERTRVSAREGRHRMRPRGVEVHDVVAHARKKVSQAHRRREVERIANRERMALDALASRALVEPSARIAGEFRTMSAAQQPERQAEHLGLASGESEFRIDAEDA